MKKDEEVKQLNGLSEGEKKALLDGEKANKPAQKPMFLKMKNIRMRDRSTVVSIKSGVDELDRRIIGFNKGELTIISGVNGSGKSSWLSQMALEAARQGFNTALFSGELTPERVLNWLVIPAAGRGNLEPTKYEHIYRPKKNVKDKIQAWLDPRVFLYNNDYGLKVGTVLSSVQRCVSAIKVDMVIIDNLMSLDMSAMGAEKYERQTWLVNALSAFAKRSNVHVFFVCHPRKVSGFLRKEDISGTADLTNAADNVLIIHRVNTDFKIRAQEYFKGALAGLEQYDNVIEVCKNRELGVQDSMVGVYFEKESRRFLNSRDEVKTYGWEQDASDYGEMVAFEGEVPPFPKES